MTVLDRIEGKVDKFPDVVIEIAGMEELFVTVYKVIYNVEALLKIMDDLLDEMERQALVRRQKIAFAKCLFWIVVNGALGLAQSLSLSVSIISSWLDKIFAIARNTIDARIIVKRLSRVPLQYCATAGLAVNTNIKVVPPPT